MQMIIHSLGRYRAYTPILIHSAEQYTYFHLKARLGGMHEILRYGQATTADAGNSCILHLARTTLSLYALPCKY